MVKEQLLLKGREPGWENMAKHSEVRKSSLLLQAFIKKTQKSDN